MVNEIIIKEVNRIFECDILARNRKQNNVDGRIAFVGFMRGFSKLTIARIGQTINKDHSIVCHYSRRHELYYKYDSGYRKKFDKLKIPKPTHRTICCYTTLEFIKYKKAS